MLIAIYGAASLGDLVWRTIADQAWWNVLLAIPGLAIFYWALAGSWRRTQRRAVRP
jgi:hypothetical protein